MDLGLQLKQPEVIHDGRSVLAQAACYDLGLEIESVAELPISASTIDGVEVLALKVFDKGELEHLLIAGIS